MNKKILLPLLSVVFLSACLYNNWGDPPVSDYHAVTPITISKTALHSSVKSDTARDIHNPGKIYVYDKYLFVVEQYEGVHVINNTDPAAPVNIGFIIIPGCVDIAAKGHTLYADNAVDLVALDISNPAAVTVTSRQEDIFPPIVPTQEWYSIARQPDYTNEVVIGWKDTVIK